MLLANQLNGFGAFQEAAGAGTPITSLTYIASTTSNNSATINCPASINAGDLLILIQRGDNDNPPGGAPADVTPSGWTDVPTTLTDTENRHSVKYKIALGTEDSSSITGVDGGLYDNKVMLQYRADIPIVSATFSALDRQSVDGNPGARTQDASLGTGIVLGITNFSTLDNGGTVDPRTTSITPDHEISSDTSFYVHDYIQASPAANYTWDMADEGDKNALLGFYVHDIKGA